MGNRFGKYLFVKKFFKKIWSYDDKILEQNICNLNFKNPIGLSAGFDYNADLVEILPSIGFGFYSIGTLTYESYAGNPVPMLSRLPRSRSLLVNKGFKNKGVKNVLVNLSNQTHKTPKGISIGATNKPYPNFDSMLKDLVAGFQDAENFKNFDYYELNISCPNLLNIQNLKEQIASPTGLKQALELLEDLDLKRPVFIKMPLEISLNETKELMDVANDFSFIRGLIFSNLVKDRTNKAFNADEIKKAGKGNFSGKPVEEKSNSVLHYAYKIYNKRFILVGVGGVFTAEDAYKKILLGASLVQLITGMVFMGPQQIGLINKELAKLLRRDGYVNVQDAIGALT
ncbi:dihydroorotate dehydrogenase (quinone) [Candidatus Nomurabacteria bacterium RIFCSPLOWO2_01_FULL_37_49]|nr:MAG: dihydroorotate dehydrogenase (quinone) [Candidatus Nomurabacteria bacterium RIFCSPLOWO2_01_FULL_37_49]